MSSVAEKYNELSLEEKVRRLEIVASAYTGWFIGNCEAWKKDVVEHFVEFENNANKH